MSGEMRWYALVERWRARGWMRAMKGDEKWMMMLEFIVVLALRRRARLEVLDGCVKFSSTTTYTR